MIEWIKIIIWFIPAIIMLVKLIQFSKKVWFTEPKFEIGEEVDIESESFDNFTSGSTEISGGTIVGRRRSLTFGHIYKVSRHKDSSVVDVYEHNLNLLSNYYG